MLGENQIKRLLKHVEGLDKEYQSQGLSKEPDDSMYNNTIRIRAAENEGWCRALRLVLEKNTYPISDKPID